MYHLPKVVIVGRPNVGKSALFNRLCGRRAAIVDEAEGVTRDRLYQEVEIFGRPFFLVDTGGIDPLSKAQFAAETRRQAQIAIEEGDVVVMVVDIRIGVTNLDIELARALLRTGKPLILAVNKADHLAQANLVYPFACLGMKNMLAVSAIQGFNIAELIEKIIELLPAQKEEDASEIVEHGNAIKIALVGKPNVGKSTLMNYLLQEERSMVSPIPGTTRDAIDMPLTIDGEEFVLIDTAGIRRKHAEHEAVEKFAALRTQKAIERCDVCILMLDATVGITLQDKKIANAIEAAGKGCIILFNKWDLVKGFRMEHCKQSAQESVPFLKHCPMFFISAKSGRNTDKIFADVKRVYGAGKQKVSTGQLNRFIAGALQKRRPPVIQGRRLRIYYMTQVGTQPPFFMLFVNSKELMASSYLRFLNNQIREAFDFCGVPLILKLRGKKARVLGKAAPAPGISALSGYQHHATSPASSDDESFELDSDDWEELEQEDAQPFSLIED